MQPFLNPVTLAGEHVSLVPLAAHHHDELAEAVQDGALWERWYTAIPSPEGMAAEISRRLDLHERGSMLPFAVIADGQAVGMTTYMNIDAANRRVGIGRNFDEIEADLLCFAQGILQFHHAQLFAGRPIDHAHFARTDPVIDPDQGRLRVAVERRTCGHGIP